MRRKELASIGRRLTHIRARDSQRAQAKRLGVAERTYQNYEQDNRPPDLRTLLGAFMQGWDLNWLVCGVGPQRVDPRAVIEHVLVETAAPGPTRSRDGAAAALRLAYTSRDFPVPAWVYEELPELSLTDAAAIVDGAWAQQPRQSHGLQQASVSLAVQLLHEVLGEASVRITPEEAGEAARILAQLLETGLPEAKVLPVARELRDSYGARGGHGRAAPIGGPAAGDHAGGGTVRSAAGGGPGEGER